jgi:hypothetical protein
VCGNNAFRSCAFGTRRSSLVGVGVCERESVRERACGDNVFAVEQ